MILWRKWKARARVFVFTRRGHETLGHVLEKQAARLGELPFCRFEDEVISYAAFNRRVNRRDWRRNRCVFRTTGLPDGQRHQFHGCRKFRCWLR